MVSGIGVVCVLIAWIMYMRRRDLYDDWMQETATVTEIIDSATHGTLRTRLTFPLPSGQTVTCELPVSGYAVGQRLPIVYDPGNPSNARIAEATPPHTSELFLGLYGAAVAVYGSTMSFLTM